MLQPVSEKQVYANPSGLLKKGRRGKKSANPNFIFGSAWGTNSKRLVYS